MGSNTQKIRIFSFTTIILVSCIILGGCNSQNTAKNNELLTNIKANTQKAEVKKEIAVNVEDNSKSILADNEEKSVKEPANIIVENEKENNISNDNSEEAIEEAIKDVPEYYKVIKVVDGDTIAVDINGVSETLRLIGINTPETKDPRKPVECYGIEASNKAEELLAGKMVELEKDETQGERDKYNRLLRYVKRKDGLFYNLEIIKQGFAYEYTYDEPYKYQAEFKEAEKYAKNNKLGLWADNACPEENKNINTETKNDTSQIIPEKNTELILEENQTITDNPEKKADCDCSYNKYNCGDFKTHDEAQAVYDCCGGASNDIHKLDSDKDGKACESLP